MLHIAVNGWFVGRDTAGSGQYLRHLLAHLPQLPGAVRLSLLVPLEQAHATWPSVTTVPLSVPLLPGPLRKVWWEQVSVPAAARRLAADVLWVPYWAAPWWQPVPVCVTVHDLIPRLLPAYRGGLHHRLYTWLVSATAQRSAAVLTVSQASKRDIVEQLGIPAGRVQVVYHGPNQADAPSPASLDDVRARYGLPPRFFLYLGGFDSRKNVAGTIAAYRRYLDLGGDPDVKLVLAGQLPRRDGAFAPDPRPIAAQVGVSEALVCCGWVDEADKPALYALATAFVFPSLYEGFGMMVLEAMAAGTPVITSA